MARAHKQLDDTCDIKYKGWHKVKVAFPNPWNAVLSGQIPEVEKARQWCKDNLPKGSYVCYYL